MNFLFYKSSEIFTFCIVFIKFALMGYCPWAALDLVSTHQGYQKRYGFIYVDRDEFDLKKLEPIKKDSFFWYKDVIAKNGADL